MKYSDVGSQCKVQKNRNLICKQNAVTYLSFKLLWPKLQVHNPPRWQKSIQSLRKIHWKIAEKNSGQTGRDGRTDRQTDRQTDRVIPVYPPQLVGGGYKNHVTCLKAKRFCATRRTQHFWKHIKCFKRGFFQSGHFSSCFHS